MGAVKLCLNEIFAGDGRGQNNEKSPLLALVTLLARTLLETLSPDAQLEVLEILPELPRQS